MPLGIPIILHAFTAEIISLPQNTKPTHSEVHQTRTSFLSIHSLIILSIIDEINSFGLAILKDALYGMSAQAEHQ